MESRIGKVEESLLHNVISQALENRRIKILPDEKMVQLLGEETARWVFDGAEGSIFGKWEEGNVTESEPAHQGVVKETNTMQEKRSNDGIASEQNDHTTGISEAVKSLFWR